MKLLKKLLSFFPTGVPIGRTAFEAWSADIIDLAGVPNNASTKFAVAMIVLHRPASEVRKSKRFYAKILRKGAANEVAATLAEEIKKQQKEEASGGLNVVEGTTSQVAPKA